MKERIIGKAGTGLTPETKLASGWFGFDSTADFIQSLMGVQHAKFNGVAALIGGLTSVIGKYVWDSPEAIYTLWGLMFADWLTGIVSAFKYKRFQIFKLGRMPVYLVATSALLALSWNLSKASLYFIPLPGIVYGGFCSVYFLSLLDNMTDIKWIPKELGNFIKSRSKLKTLFSKKDSEQQN